MNEIEKFGKDPVMQLLQAMRDLRYETLQEQEKIREEHQLLKEEYQSLQEKCKQLEHESSELHRALKHKRGFLTIQAFSRKHELGLSTTEANRHGIVLSARLKRLGRYEEINKTEELNEGAKNEKVNEYSVSSLCEHFGISNNGSY